MAKTKVSRSQVSAAPRVSSTSSTASLTIDSDSVDLYRVTALSGNITVNAPSGSPADGQKLTLYLKDNGSARTITWNAVFRAAGPSLPTTTTAGKMLRAGFEYHNADTKWDLVALSTQP